MKLNAPTQIVFLIAVVLAVLAILSTFVAIPVVSGYAFWILTAAFVLLAASNILKGL
ncbi:MAG: hypothetical protein JKX98_07995 [Alcanivoracaceae bacterium]|nr:hypothetical protein [Alcanivoracaceae bacterium]